MAEFCLDCWNKFNDTHDPPEKYHISRYLNFCEGCAQWKPTIICVRLSYRLREYFRARKKQKL